MPTLIYAHVITGLLGIVAGLVSVGGMFYQKSLPRWNAVFLVTTALACTTGLVFLPIDGVTSAQLVSFFLTALLAVAAFARYVRNLDGVWNQVYALTAVGALFLDVLIATAQSFQHIRGLQDLAPTQQSPFYVVLKFSLLVLFVVIALVVVRRVGPSGKTRA